MSELIDGLVALYGQLEKEHRAKEWALIARTVAALEQLTTTNQSLMAEVEKLRGQVPKIYDAGWIECALWAERLDLITDCESGAFERDKEAAIQRVVAPQALHAEEAKQ